MNKMSKQSEIIFGNQMPRKVVKKASNNKNKLQRKFGDDSKATYHLLVEDNPILGDSLGIKNILATSEKTNVKKNGTDHNFDQKTSVFDPKGIIVGNIRMGFGHYRISMAIASAAKHMGFTPYWFDLHSFKETTGGKVIAHLNDLYSMGSRWSQKYPLFNKLYWEPLNSEGFKKLSYNALDQEMATLMTPVFRELPKELPYVATHVWPAQAAVHAGVKKVVNVIPDNWPMALHLAEGSIHVVQTPSSYFGYRTLKNMNKSQINQSIPGDKIQMVGHYIDHELVSNLESDTASRLARVREKKAKRFLITVGGAGAQKEIFVQIIKTLIPYIKKNKAVLHLNVGDHLKVWEGLCQDIPELDSLATKHFDDWKDTQKFAEHALDQEVSGIHAFYHKDIFAAVYSTNLLMRSSDVLITKPSELSFYPIPKLLIKRVGGHEAWGAVRSAEIGDGTLECESVGLTVQMLELLLNSDDILTHMCQNILKANKIGVYNGAYKAVAIAAGMDPEEVVI